MKIRWWSNWWAFGFMRGAITHSLSIGHLVIWWPRKDIDNG